MGSGSVCHVYPDFQGTNGYTVPGNQGTQDKLNHINFNLLIMKLQGFLRNL